jgi:uncharacterized protein (TIGR03000 family)
MRARNLVWACAVCAGVALVAQPALAQRGGGGGGRGGGGGGGGGRGMSGGGGGGRAMSVPSGGRSMGSMPGAGRGPGMSMSPNGARPNPAWSGRGPNGNWWGNGNNFRRGNWNSWGWGGWGIGFFIPVYIGSFGPGVWVASDYPGYFSYYGDDGAVPNGVLYGAPMEYGGGDPSQVGPGEPNYNAPGPNLPDNLAYVTIRVPNADAKVWIEDVATTDSGAVREYRSPELTKGKNYTYEIRAEWKEGDQVRKQTRKFPIHAGDHIMVVFGTKEQQKDKVPPVPAQEK